jgi:hypothetical protein
MEQKDHLNFCEACGHKLEGEHYLCPFCGYRLFETDYAPEEGHFSPPASDFISEIKEEHPPVPIEEEPNLKPETYKSLAEPIKPDKVNKKKRKWIIVSVSVSIFLLSAVAVGYLYYSGTISLPLFRSTVHSKPIINEGQQSPESFYFCYALAVADNKPQVILSNVFTRIQVGYSNSSAISEFERYIRLRYPENHEGFKPVICKKCATFEEADREREKSKSGFISKNYKLRFIEL